MNRELNRDLVDACAIARDLAREFGRSPDGVLFQIRDRAVVCDLARRLAGYLALARDFDRPRTRELVRARNLARALARALSRGYDGELDRARTRADHIVAVLEERRRPLQDSAAAEAVRRVTPARAAVRLADRAVRALPVDSRCRYREEFGSELYELAAAGASWWDS